MKVIWIIITLFGSFSRPITPADSLPLDSEEYLDVEDIPSGTVIWEEYYDSETVAPFNSAEEDNEKGATEDSVVLSRQGIPLNDSILIKEERNGSEAEIVEAESQFNSPKHNDAKSGDDNICGDPPLVENGEIVAGKSDFYEVGSEVTFACKFGFSTDGVMRTVQCVLSEENRTEWTNPQILCIPRSCGDPGFVENGYRTGSLFTFPNSISFECDEGYKLRGNNIQYCQTNGKWSGRIPTCERVYCDPPGNIENGKVSYPSLEFGSELRYQCNPGFRLKKHTIRYCLSNGTWSGDDPVCQDSDCEVPEAPEHGTMHIVGGKASVDSRAIYTCEDNKILKGSRISICLEEGKWTFPPPKCLDPCTVPDVPNGRIGRYKNYYRGKRFEEIPVGTKLNDGQELYLFCKNNYEPLGKPSIEEKIVCDKGQWLDIPRCEPATCKTWPPRVSSSGLLKIGRHHGGTVLYKCFEGFKKTPGNITCNFGSWIGKPPICTDTRCHINDISFPGVLKGNKTAYLNRESFIPICDSNHTTARPNNVLTCQSGMWKGHLPPCTAASCMKEPPSIEHGSYKYYSKLHSSIVSYECDEPFRLVESSSNIQCNFGRWIGTPPSCKDKRCNVEDLDKTEGMVTNDTFTTSGEYLQMRCDAGYTETGNKPLCSMGIWSQLSPPCAESDCSIYQILNGGITTKVNKQVRREWSFKYDTVTSFEKVKIRESKSPGTTLYVTCNAPYTFQGKGTNHVTTTCRKGKWYPRPLCLSTGTPYKEESTSTTMKLPSISTTVQNLKTTEASKLVSKTSVSAESCSCTYNNNDPGLVAFSGSDYLQNGMKIKDGCKVKFHCKEFGYHQLKGPTEISCKDCRTWHSSEYPECRLPEKGQTIIDFNRQGYILPGGIFGVEQGGSYRISCIGLGVANYPEWKIIAKGHNMEFRYYRSREDGLYSYMNILDIVYANSDNNGKYECALKGYRPTVFEINVLGSTVTCPKFIESEDLIVHYNDQRTVNSNATFQCKDEKKDIVGSTILTCLSDGQWSGSPPQCNLRIKCPKLQETEGLTISYSQDYNVDSLAVFHCFSPRIRSGAANSICKKNGEWSEPVPFCLLPSCSLDSLFRVVPENVIPVMENVHNDTLPYNFTLHLKCAEDNLALQGSEIARCGEEGHWKVSSVQCVPGCSSLQIPDKTLIVEPEKSFYRIGEIVTLSCPEGQHLSTDVLRVMCIDPNWSEEEIPHCQVVE